jgi:4'-phosphopantetheinyl transferase EntD
MATTQIASWVRSCCPAIVGVGTAHENGETEATADPADVAAMPASFVPQRRTTFLLGRAAARHAMADLGRTPVHLPRSLSGAPAWPADLLGSISHTAALAIAVAASRETLRGLGVDIESAARVVSRGVVERVMTDRERASGLAASLNDSAFAMRLFCAKEAAFKALGEMLPPRQGFWNITLSAKTDTEFLAEVDAVDGLPICSVRTALLDDHVVALAVIAATPPARPPI